MGWKFPVKAQTVQQALFTKLFPIQTTSLRYAIGIQCQCVSSSETGLAD